MKYIIAIALAFATMISSAHAQSKSSGQASAVTNSTLNSATDARSYTDARTAVLLDQRSQGTDSTLRTAPQVAAPSMSSGHPCAYTTMSASVSIIGGGIGAGGQKIDDACLLGQLGKREASVHMIASRNIDACKALRAAGDLHPSTLCGKKEVEAAKRTQAAQPTGVSARNRAVAHGDSGEQRHWSKCERSSRGIEVRLARGADRATAITQCKAFLR